MVKVHKTFIYTPVHCRALHPAKVQCSFELNSVRCSSPVAILGQKKPTGLLPQRTFCPNLYRSSTEQYARLQPASPYGWLWHCQPLSLLEPAKVKQGSRACSQCWARLGKQSVPGATCSSARATCSPYRSKSQGAAVVPVEPTRTVKQRPAQLWLCYREAGSS